MWDNKINNEKQKWYVSEVGMYPAGMQPVGFARMYLSCTQTDPRIQWLQY